MYIQKPKYFGNTDGILIEILEGGDLPEKPDGFEILSEFFKNSSFVCSSDKYSNWMLLTNNKESAIWALYLILLHSIFVTF